MSAMGRYVTTMLDQEQQLYSRNLAIACTLLGVSNGAHGSVVYCMEREIHKDLTKKLEKIAESNHLDSGSAKAMLQTLARCMFCSRTQDPRMIMCLPRLRDA
jgi:hypothetical protein